MNDIATSFRAGHTAAIQSFAKVSGLVAGTAVMTMQGPVDASLITAGTRIIARSGARAVRSIDCVEVPLLRMVEVPANAIAAGIPEQTVFLAPETLVALPSQATALYARIGNQDTMIRPKAEVIRAADLSDAGFPVRYRTRANVALFEITLDAPDTIYASTLQICIGKTF